MGLKTIAALAAATLLGVGCAHQARAPEGTGGSGTDTTGTSIPADQPDVINGPTTPPEDNTGTGGSGTISEDGADRSNDQGTVVDEPGADPGDDSLTPEEQQAPPGVRP